MNKEKREYYRAMKLSVSSGTFAASSATIEIQCGGRQAPLKKAVIGEGSVDAIFKAIMSATGTSNRLVSFSLNAVTNGTEADADCVVQLLTEIKGRAEVIRGKGSDKDILCAAAYAYINALNRIEILSED